MLEANKESRFLRTVAPWHLHVWVATVFCAASACDDAASPAADSGVDPAPDSATEPTGHALDFPGHADHPATEDILHHIDSALSRHADDYDTSLEAMCSHGQDTVDVLTEEFHDLPHEQDFQRWLLVHTLGECHHEASLAFYDELLHTPLHDDGEPAAHHDMHTADPEALIHLAGLRGVLGLAADGDGDARSLLADIAVVGEDPAVRAVAIDSYMASADDMAAAREELAARLAEDDQYLLDYEVITGAPDEPPMPHTLSNRHGTEEGPSIR
jgi:hypothetical protein